MSLVLSVRRNSWHLYALIRRPRILKDEGKRSPLPGKDVSGNGNSINKVRDSIPVSVVRVPFSIPNPKQNIFHTPTDSSHVRRSPKVVLQQPISSPDFLLRRKQVENIMSYRATLLPSCIQHSIGCAVVS